MAVTFGRLRKILDYDPDTGVFMWRVSTGRTRAGDVAGTVTQRGYRQININYKSYLAHRLAWMHVHGKWPPDDIDHINGDPLDNRLVNLRLATRSQNNANARKRSDSTSGHKGVSWCKPNGKWQSQIAKNGVKIHLGYHTTPQEAHAAYCAAAEKLFGEFARPICLQ